MLYIERFDKLLYLHNNPASGRLPSEKNTSEHKRTMITIQFSALNPISALFRVDSICTVLSGPYASPRRDSFWG